MNILPKFKVRNLVERKTLSDKEAYINVDDLENITLHDALREFNGNTYELIAYSGYRSLDGVDIYENDIVEVYKYGKTMNDFSPTHIIKIGIGKVNYSEDLVTFWVHCDSKHTTRKGKKYLDSGFADYSMNDDTLEFKKVGEYYPDNIF